MISLHLLHPFTPRPELSFTRITPINRNFTHKTPLFILRKKISFKEAFHLSESIKHKLLTIKAPAKNKTVKLTSFFALCCFQNVMFNICNKKALIFFPFPWLIASFQLLVSSLWISALWAAKIQPFPCVNSKFVHALLSPAFFHAIAHVSAIIAFSKLSVSFTHIIKVSEPIFSVTFSALHGQFYPIHIWLSVIPIFTGCAIAAATEASFNTSGLFSALISNASFVLRNIYSKQSFYEFKHVDGRNLYGWISIVSFCYLFPVAVIMEGRLCVEGYRAAVAAAAGSERLFCFWVVLSGVFWHLCNRGLYEGFDEMRSLKVSIGNVMKTMVVIIASVIVFGDNVGVFNAFGSAVAMFGAFLYCWARAGGRKGKKMKKKIVIE